MKKEESTKEKILKTAIEVFKSVGYDNGSILKIASKAGIKNSTVYYYFKNKGDIYNELALKFRRGLIERIKNSLEVSKDPLENIKTFIKVYVEYIKENINLYDAFREVEFVNLELARNFYKELTGYIKTHLKDLIKENFDVDTLSFSIVGSVYFLVIKNLIWDNKDIEPTEMETIYSLIENGIDKTGDFKPYFIQEKKIAEDTRKFQTKGEKTKQNIIKFSEKLFGKKGYRETQIADIAIASNIGLGTIYLYFNSKKEILAEVIRNVSHTLRKCSYEYTKDLKDRREIENGGFQAFFYVFKNRGDDYRIVRESEFVDRELGAWYYKRIASSYIKGIEAGIRMNEIRELEAEVLSYSLMGIGHSVGINWFVLKKNNKINENSVSTVLNFIMHGLKSMLKEKV